MICAYWQKAIHIWLLL